MDTPFPYIRMFSLPCSHFITCLAQYQIVAVLVVYSFDDCVELPAFEQHLCITEEWKSFVSKPFDQEDDIPGRFPEN